MLTPTLSALSSKSAELQKRRQPAQAQLQPQLPQPPASSISTLAFCTRPPVLLPLLDSSTSCDFIINLSTLHDIQISNLGDLPPLPQPTPPPSKTSNEMLKTRPLSRLLSQNTSPSVPSIFIISPPTDALLAYSTHQPPIPSSVSTSTSNPTNSHPAPTILRTRATLLSNIWRSHVSTSTSSSSDPQNPSSNSTPVSPIRRPRDELERRPSGDNPGGGGTKGTEDTEPLVLELHDANLVLWPLKSGLVLCLVGALPHPHPKSSHPASTKSSSTSPPQKSSSPLPSTAAHTTPHTEPPINGDNPHPQPEPPTEDNNSHDPPNQHTTHPHPQPPSTPPHHPPSESSPSPTSTDVTLRPPSASASTSATIEDLRLRAQELGEFIDGELRGFRMPSLGS